MNVQYLYKDSAKVNATRDTLVQSLVDLQASLDAIQIYAPVGCTFHAWVRSVVGDRVYLNGMDWWNLVLVDADVLRTDGATWGDHGIITAHGRGWITVSTLVLVAGDRIRIEVQPPALDFFEVDISIIDYGDLYL